MYNHDVEKKLHVVQAQWCATPSTWKLFPISYHIFKMQCHGRLKVNRVASLLFPGDNLASPLHIVLFQTRNAGIDTFNVFKISKILQCNLWLSSSVFHNVLPEIMRHLSLLCNSSLLINAVKKSTSKLIGNLILIFMQKPNGNYYVCAWAETMS